MTDPYTTIFLHISRTLPDSLSARRELLVATRALMKVTHPAAKDIDAQIAVIEAIDKLQGQLTLLLEEQQPGQP